MRPSEPIYSFGHFKDRKKQAKNLIIQRRRDRSQSNKLKETYSPKNETRAHAWHLLAHDDIERKVNNACDIFLHELLSTILNDEEVVSFHKAILECKKGPPKATTTFAFVGPQGIGKSTSINALLHRPGLAESKQDRAACTHYATRYIHKADAPDDIDESDVTIYFLPFEKLDRIIDEHIRHWLYYHYSMLEDLEILDDDDEITATLTLDKKDFSETERRLERTAMEFFHNILNTENDPQAKSDLEALLNQSSVHRGDLVRKCHEKVIDRKRNMGAMEDHIYFANVKDKNIKDVLDIAKRMWTIVDMVVIATGSAILRDGICLIDLPGSGDLNQSRTAIINAIRREADYEIIMDQIARLSTRQDADQNIRNSIKAHGINNTIMVLNQIDQYCAEDIEEEIKRLQVPPFPDIRKRMEEHENRSLDSDDEQADDLHESYRQHLLRVAECAWAHIEAEMAAETMKEIHGDQLKVFAITAREYTIGMKGDRKTDPKFVPEMTGIPAFRRSLRLITAEQNFKNALELIFQSMPGLAEKAHRISKKYLDNAGNVQMRRKSKNTFQRIKNDLQNHIADAFPRIVPRIWLWEKSDIELRVKHAISKWSTRVKWQTFKKTARENGIPVGSRSEAYQGRNVNWNKDLLHAIEAVPGVGGQYERPPVQQWKNQVLGNATRFISLIQPLIASFFDDMQDIIDYSSSEPELKKRTRAAWERTERNIRRLLEEFPASFAGTIMSAFRYATTEEDVNCMIAELNAGIYQSVASVPSGDGLYKRMRDKLSLALTNPDCNGKTFLDRYEDAAKERMKNNLCTTISNFQTGFIAELDEFTIITEQFLWKEDNQTLEHCKLIDRLKVALPKFEKQLLELQRMFPGCNYQTDVEVHHIAKRIKFEPEDD